MLSNGASGYVLKNAMPEEIIMGIETIMNGEIFLCHEIDILMKKETDKHVFLTRRETDLLRLITEGFTNQEISEKLFLGAETIKSYRKNLLFKLNAKNTASLVKMALEGKLV
jgi:DNA-binding NarL/FixJ family response regulator